MKKSIVILANDYDLLRAQVDNLPELPGIDYIVCIEDRIGTKLEKIKEIVNCEVLLASGIVEKFQQIFSNKFVDEYTMGMNILLQWYFFKFRDYDRVLFTEDDVIITKDVIKLFEEPNCMFMKSSISAGPIPMFVPIPGRKMDVTKHLEWDRIFDLKLKEDPKLWHSTSLYSGQRYYVKAQFNLELYEKCLIEFFKSELFYGYWKNRTSHRTQFLDEKFEGFFAHISGILNGKLKKYCRVEIRGLKDKDLSGYKQIERCNGLWHNATVSHKHAWVKELKKCGKIK